MGKRPPRRMTETASDRDPKEASPWLYKLMESYGFSTDQPMATFKALRVVARLKQRKTLCHIAAEFAIVSWEQIGPSEGQIKMLDWKVPNWRERQPRAKCRRDASVVLDVKLNPEKFQKERLADIDKAKSEADLDAVGYDMLLAKGLLAADVAEAIVEVGKAKRAELKDGTLPE